MDINFHYYAVKTIALHAGFSDDDAQLIAGYSQFVDDYDIWKNYIFERVPDYASSLVQVSFLGYHLFYTVTTGFNSIPDYGRLFCSKYQNEICVPFHFIPTRRLRDIDVNSSTRTAYRTQEATINGDFLIAQLMTNAREQYLRVSSNSETERRKALIRVGMLLHIFADTYSHNGFSGQKGWENNAFIREAKNVFTRENITQNYKGYSNVPAIGHAEIGTAPDDAYADIEWSQKDVNANTLAQHERSNLQRFIVAAEQILYYLGSLLGNEPDFYAGQVVGNLRDILRKGFQKTPNGSTDLRKWNEVYPVGNYHYNKNDYWERQLGNFRKITIPVHTVDIPQAFLDNFEVDNAGNYTAIVYASASDDFFNYNLIAKAIRDAVIE